MPEKPNSQKTEIAISIEARKSNTSVNPNHDVEAPLEKTFQMVIMGDFSGRSSIDKALPVSPKIIRFDRYDFLQLFKSLNVSLTLPADRSNSEQSCIQFEDMDSFHPDQLLHSDPVLKTLLQIKNRLKDSSTIEEAALELERLTPMQKKSPETAEGSGRDVVAELLKPNSDLVSKQPDSSDNPLNKFVKDAVESHLMPDHAPQQKRLVSNVNQLLSNRLHYIMGHPRFKQLESAWQALYFLITNLDTNPNLRFTLVDISKEELAADLRLSKSLEKSSIFKLLVEKSGGTTGVMPWSVMIGDYFFKHSTDDIELLHQIGKIALAADVPFIAGGDPSLIGAEALNVTPDPDDWNITLKTEASEAWQELKTLPEARNLGLILPRFLLRIPYGEKTSPCQAIDFDELTQESHHDGYLWGNAAFLCAYLIGNSFNNFGWDLNSRLTGKIEGLPMHVYRDEMETKIIPCGETILSDRAGQVIRKAGLIPLFSIPETDSIYLAPLNAVDNSPITF